MRKCEPWQQLVRQVIPEDFREVNFFADEYFGVLDTACSALFLVNSSTPFEATQNRRDGVVNITIPYWIIMIVKEPPYNLTNYFMLIKAMGSKNRRRAQQ